MFGNNQNQEDHTNFSQGLIDEAAQADMPGDSNVPAGFPADNNAHSGTGAPAMAAPLAAPTLEPLSTTTPATAVPADDLMAIKQNALQLLTPLVGHLEQSPEEKFRTTMMMIQASDDHSLIKEAYSSAQAITDEKARAQALLDIVNEINYFTQGHQS